MLEIEDHELSVAFAPKFAAIDELKHEFFMSIAADTDALLALEKLTHPMTADAVTMDILRKKTKDANKKLLWLEENHAMLLVELAKAGNLLNDKRRPLMEEIYRRESEKRARKSEIEAEVERTVTLNFANERAALPPKLLVIVSIPFSATRHAKELCDDMKTDFPATA